MTFTEAAEAVLRKVGKPLHYKKITQFAIEQNLLSHVGKTPEVTMSTRLATLAKKDKGEAAIVRVKPGVFGLRDWGAAVVAAGADEGDEAGEELAEGEVPAAAAGEGGEAAEAPPAPVRSIEEQEREKRLVAGSQLFPEEADDDEPVFGEKPAPAVPAGTAAGAGGAARAATDADKLGEGGKRRRRRRRRGGGRADRPEGAPGAEAAPGALEDGDEGDEGDEDLSAPGMEGPAGESEGDEGFEAPGADGAERPEGVAAEGAEGVAGAEGVTMEARAPREPRRDGRRDDRRGDRGEGRGDRGEARGEGRGEGRGEMRGEMRGEGRGEMRGEGRGEMRGEGRGDERRGDEPRGELREEIGRDAADMLVSMLTRREDRQPVPLRALVDDATRAGKIAGDPNLLVPSLAAAARMDGVRREARGERPRLRIANGRVGLVDWALGPDLVRAEADALATVERLRDAARRMVIRRLNELPQAAFTELVVLLLERMGISSLRGARRPGLPQGELHLAGVARRALEELRVGVLVKRGGEIGRERVIELRGSLHHYGPAASAWIITTGNVLSGARDEASQTGTAPITLIDGAALGRLFDEHAVGVRHASVSIPYLDFDLFDALRV